MNYLWLIYKHQGQMEVLDSLKVVRLVNAEFHARPIASGISFMNIKYHTPHARTIM